MLQNKSAYLVQVLKVRPLYFGTCCEHSRVLCTAEVNTSANKQSCLFGPVGCVAGASPAPQRCDGKHIID